MVESVLDSETHVRGFADRLGERFIVPQPSGSLLEHLNFRRDLASAPFFEPAVKERLARLANFRHASYTRARRLRTGDRGTLVLVSTHTPGRHLSEILQTASRNGFRPPTAAVLWLTRQLLTSVALLHDYGPDVFHGAIGPERVILAGEGRVVLAEYVLGTAVEQAVGPWGVHHLWRELRLATLADFDLPGYGRRVDLLQVGLVTLAFFLGRPLTPAEFPEGLAQALDDATEAGADGAPTALREELRSWIRRMVCLDPHASFRSLLDGQKALGQLLQDSAAYPASSSALQAFVDQCESAPWYQHAPEVEPPRHEAEPGLPAAAEVEKGPETTPAEPVSPLDLVGPFEPPMHSAPDSFGAAAPEEPARGLPGADDAGWAPTPEPDVRTLFEAPPAPPPPPPGLAPAVEHRFEADGGRHGVPAPAAVQGPPSVAAEAVDIPAPRPRAEQRPESPRRVGETAPPPAAPAPAATRTPRHGTVAAPAAWRPVPRPARFTPFRIGLAAGGLVVAVLLALAVPRFWGGGATPAQGNLVVESDPSGAEVSVDGREVGSTPVTIKAAPGAHKLEVRIGGSSRSVWVNVPEGGTLKQSVELSEAMQRSGLRITTHPPGGTVTVNGTPSGKSPVVRVSDLQPGLQTLLVEGPFGPVESEVQVEPGEVKSVRVPTAGWVLVSAPFDLEVMERNRSFGNTAGGPVMVPIGRHHFDLVNRELHVRAHHFVDVPPGKTVPVPFEAQSGMMNFDADQPAEVLLDGTLLGQTPLVSVPVPLGPHEVVFRHAKLGEVRDRVVVTLAAPVRLSVTFNKK
ncbi:MAG: PEGA domain-containing protein [Acidobacteria bacterium]|nr:MAG: PEGA domain-containing protein [Acidobacteriota bacterium]